MNCENFSENIIFLLDGQLDVRDSVALEDHKASCESCNLLYNQIADAYAMIGIERELKPNPFFYHKLKSRLEGKNNAKVEALLMKILAPIAIAASISLGILIGNGEINMINYEDADLELVSENFSPSTPVDYSIWTNINEENGDQN